MKKIVFTILTFLLSINFIRAENVGENIIPTVYSQFYIGYERVHIEGLWKDLNNYNHKISAIQLDCEKDFCAEKQANLVLLGYPEQKPLLCSDDNEYIIVEKSKYNLKLKSTCENYEGYIFINLKTKEVIKTKKYKHQKEIDKYKLLTTQEECDKEIQRIFNSKK